MRMRFGHRLRHESRCGIKRFSPLPRRLPPRLDLLPPRRIIGTMRLGRPDIRTPMRPVLPRRRIRRMPDVGRFGAHWSVVGARAALVAGVHCTLVALIARTHRIITVSAHDTLALGTHNTVPFRAHHAVTLRPHDITALVARTHSTVTVV